MNNFSNKHSLPLIILFIFSLPNIISAQSSPWELTTSKNDIEVFTRTNSDCKIKEIRIQTLIKTNLDNLFTVLQDVAEYPSWVYKGAHSKLLERLDENTFYYYTASNFPFPFSDRDLVVLSKKWYDENTATWHSFSKAQPDYLPEEGGMVRIQAFESRWKIKDLGNGTVQIDYEATTDPGGMLPAWIINLGITTGPTKTMTALKEKLEGMNRPTSLTMKK